MYPCPPETCPYKIQPGDTLWLIAQRFHTTPEAIASINLALDEKSLRVGQIICIPRGKSAPRGSSQPAPRTPSQPTLPAGPPPVAPAPPQSAPGSSGKAEQALGNSLRLLWEQHVYWTRMFILSTAFGLPDAEPVTDRLLRNPGDFGAALKPFYGEDKALTFAKLLTDHLTVAAELVKAAKAGDTAAANNAEKRWYGNADDIAVFLGRANRFWSAQEWRKMMYDHLAMTKAEAVDILTKKYADGIKAFTDIERQALMMADTMTRGITKQFPQQFR